MVLILEATIGAIQQRVHLGMQQARAGTCYCKAQAPLHVELKDAIRLRDRRAEQPAPDSRRTCSGKLLVKGMPRRIDTTERTTD
jgi:hypothetical protein